MVSTASAIRPRSLWSPGRSPSLTFVASTFASAAIWRSKHWPLVISWEQMAIPAWLAPLRAMFSARAVFPIAGRAAITTRLFSRSPPMIWSRSTNPVRMPGAEDRISASVRLLYSCHCSFARSCWVTQASRTDEPARRCRAFSPASSAAPTSSASVAASFSSRAAWSILRRVAVSFTASMYRSTFCVLTTCSGSEET